MTPTCSNQIRSRQIGHYISWLSVRPSFHHNVSVPLCMQCPSNARPSTHDHVCIAMSVYDVYVHLIFSLDVDLHITCSQRSCFFIDFLRWSPLLDTTVRAGPSKRYAYSMSTWCRCAVSTSYFLSWPPFVYTHNIHFQLRARKLPVCFCMFLLGHCYCILKLPLLVYNII